MALPVARVHALSDVKRLLGNDVPYLVHVRRAESVRAAAEMAALLNDRLGIAEEEIGESDGNEEIDSDTDNPSRLSGNADGKDKFGSPSSEEEEDVYGGGGDDDDEGGKGNGWIVLNMGDLRRVAHLAGLLKELVDEVIPLLEVDPSETTTLQHLLVIGKDIHRPGEHVPGNAGQLAVTLGNRIQKLVGHAFNKRHKEGKARKLRELRTKEERGRWVADRRCELLDQVKGAYQRCPVPMDPEVEEEEEPAGPPQAS